MNFHIQNNIVRGYKKVITQFLESSKYEFGVNLNKSDRINSLSATGFFKKTEQIVFDFQSPSLISNVIIECDETNLSKNTFIFNNLLKILESFTCKHIVVSCLNFVPIVILKKKLEQIHDYNIHSIIVICDYYKEYHSDQFGKVIMDLKVNKKLVVLKSPFEKNYENTMFFTQKAREINYTKTLREFNSNISLFSESQLHHTYFNRKLYIGPTGEIKNAPETEQVFGYIQDITEDELKEIISSPHFQKYWFVHKGLIDVCKECEFRHMCVDNRVPIERKSNEWYNSLECNYNPYIGKWEGEEGYLSLADCGVVSNEKGFIIDHEKVRKINSNNT